MRTRYWIKQSVFDVERVWLPSLDEDGQQDASAKIETRTRRLLTHRSAAVIAKRVCFVLFFFFYLQCQAVGEW